MTRKETRLKEVKATREGLIGGITAAGLTIRSSSHFVALPSTKALWRIVRVRQDNRVTLAVVLDVGPWNEHDDEYVFGSKPPSATSGIDTRNRKTNGAGIDLSESVCRSLGWKPRQGEAIVEWELLEP